MLRRLGLSKEELPDFIEYDHSFVNLDYMDDDEFVDNHNGSDDSTYHSGTDYSYSSENESESSEDTSTKDEESDDDILDLSLSSDSVYTDEGVEYCVNISNSTEYDALEDSTIRIESSDEISSNESSDTNDEADDEDDGDGDNYDEDDDDSDLASKFLIIMSNLGI